MSEDIRDDGGQAFPVGPSVDGANYFPGNPGMSLRDYFAAAALQGDLVSDGVGAAKTEQTQEYAGLMARRAYRYADAMLKARQS